MRLWLALRVFFAILFGRALPSELTAILGPEAESLRLPSADKASEDDALVPPIESSIAPAAAAPGEDPLRIEAAAIQVLALFQNGGRLIDFLSEKIDDYADADIGAAVRDIHRGLRRTLEEHFPVKPIRTEEEDAPIHVPSGFDPAELRLVGRVVGEPPFNGRLKHKGWRVEQVQLPRVPDGPAARIVAPAEVEL